MKNTALVFMAAITLLAGPSMPAQAMNKEWAAAAGFVGGVLVANSYNSYGCRPVTYRERIVERPVYVQPRYTQVVYEAPRPRGYYKTRHETVWVPGSWFYQDAGCGTYRKLWQPGCYRSVPVRAWVPTYNHYSRW